MDFSGADEGAGVEFSVLLEGGWGSEGGTKVDGAVEWSTVRVAVEFGVGALLN